MFINNVRLITTVASVFSFLFLVSGASAFDMRMHSSICTTQFDNNGTGVSNASFLANNKTTSVTVRCPFPSSTSLRHSSVSVINVHGFEAAGENNTSTACVKHFNNTGVACGTSKSWGNGNAGVFGVDASAWRNNFASFAYIYNRLDVGGDLYGYYVAD